MNLILTFFVYLILFFNKMPHFASYNCVISKDKPYANWLSSNILKIIKKYSILSYILFFFYAIPSFTKPCESSEAKKGKVTSSQVALSHNVNFCEAHVSGQDLPIICDTSKDFKDAFEHNQIHIENVSPVTLYVPKQKRKQKRKNIKPDSSAFDYEPVVYDCVNACIISPENERVVYEYVNASIISPSPAQKSSPELDVTVKRQIIEPDSSAYESKPFVPDYVVTSTLISSPAQESSPESDATVETLNSVPFVWYLRWRASQKVKTPIYSDLKAFKEYAFRNGLMPQAFESWDKSGRKPFRVYTVRPAPEL